MNKGISAIRTEHGAGALTTGHSGSESASNAAGLTLVDATTQIAALPQQALPLVVAEPAPGERVDINLASDMVLRFAFDLKGAQIAVVDGKILLTLPTGAVIALSGDLVAQFLAGGDGALQDVLSSAAGATGSPEHHAPSSPTFQHAHHLESLGAALDSTGAQGSLDAGGQRGDGRIGSARSGQCLVRAQARLHDGARQPAGKNRVDPVSRARRAAAITSSTSSIFSGPTSVAWRLDWGQ